MVADAGIVAHEAQRDGTHDVLVLMDKAASDRRLAVRTAVFSRAGVAANCGNPAPFIPDCEPPVKVPGPS